MSTYPPPPELPIEPLPDLDWQRIERNLFARVGRGEARGPARVSPVVAPPGWSRRAILTGVGLAAVAGALLWWTQRDSPVADSQPSQVAVADAPSRVATTDAPSALSIGNVSLEIAPHSAVLIDSHRPAGLLLVLERGSVRARIAGGEGDSPAAVHAGDVRIEARDSYFAAHRSGDSAVVEVFDRSVQVLHQGRRTSIAAGSVWPEQSAPAMGTNGASSAVQDDPHDTEPKAAGSTEQPDQMPADEPHPARPKNKEARHATDKQRYEAAAKLEQSDPDAALAIYRRLAATAGPWSANALFAQARLELDLGREARARRLLEKYRARYPRGANARDAEALLDRIE